MWFILDRVLSSRWGAKARHTNGPHPDIEHKTVSNTALLSEKSSTSVFYSKAVRDQLVLSLVRQGVGRSIFG